MKKIVFIRHGESVWNKKNLFTGWTDVDLTEKGVADARNAGKILRQGGFLFYIAYTSSLKRAIKTLHHVLDTMDLLWITEYKTWVLNERHYGALQGLNKAETAEKYGADQVKIWRRSYDVKPPQLDEEKAQEQAQEEKYRNVSPALLPRGENLKETVTRVVPFWQDTIVPLLQQDKKIIIAAHGNSLRALVKYIDKVPDDEIVNLEIPTGVPLVYEFDDELQPLKHYYLQNSVQ
ncbi:2,3-diphosphoglycerate-dependent phosphoglycerate mutase [Anaerosinus massiliensis]|uniref:2,3-diphosphoglycerate-dependent phosphoglycerate mutase n=1 Tax=Massilibacillus massiliensis TaxID=1806837 RepID=UPI000A601476|nr:2,3-diphosphoglycerate-dependent phosphoglycerate mutase [Massilibacillus massiliensis]